MSAIVCTWGEMRTELICAISVDIAASLASCSLSSAFSLCAADVDSSIAACSDRCSVRQALKLYKKATNSAAATAHGNHAGPDERRPATGN